MRSKDIQNLFIVAAIFLILWAINQPSAEAAQTPTVPPPVVPPNTQNPLSFQMDYNAYLDH